MSRRHPAVIAVEPGSPAEKAGVQPGFALLAVNGQPVRDVLDYKFLCYEPALRLTVRKPGGAEAELSLRHPPGGDLGLTFESYLMDSQHTCRNRCIFCFIDQNPKGLRESLYVKDDDARLSFLLGQYITLTNLSERDVERIVRQRISPLHISVHCTDPDTRRVLLRHPRAGDCLDILRRFKGLILHGQVVVCPGVNDGAVLEQTLRDLAELDFASVSVVPVGLTCHRAGLTELRPVTRELAREILDMVARYPRTYASDELYLLAERPLPPPEHYDDFPQLENGVGMLALFREQWEEAWTPPAPEGIAPFSIATGTAAAPFLRELLQDVPAAHTVYAVPNQLFGERVTVAGLLCGGDVADALEGRELHQRLLISRAMLRREGDLFLDGTTPSQLSARLGVPVVPVENDGAALKEAICRS